MEFRGNRAGSGQFNTARILYKCRFSDYCRRQKAFIPLSFLIASIISVNSGHLSPLESCAAYKADKPLQLTTNLVLTIEITIAEERRQDVLRALAPPGGQRWWWH